MKDYKLNLRDFVPLKGWAKYDKNNLTNEFDENYSNALKRGVLLASYNAVLITLAGIAWGVGAGICLEKILN